MNIFTAPPLGRTGLAAVGQVLHGVLVATSDPLVDTSVAVHRQEALVTAPHLDSRMMTPSSAQTGKGAPYLVRLHTLLAEPAVVQYPDRLIKVGKWGKGHHLPKIFV